MKIVSSLFLLALGTSSAFTSPLRQSRATALSVAAAPAAQDEIFFKAVEMAEEAGLHARVDLEELNRLATQLEQFEGCYYENEASSCEKEIQDRMDVAQILRLQIELHMRLEYLKKSNLFAKDVHKEHDQQDRKKFKEALLANRDKALAGSDLGLW